MRNESLSRDQKVSVPFGAGPPLAVAGGLPALALLVGTDEAGTEAPLALVVTVVLDDVLVDGLLLDEHAEPSSPITMLAAPTATHVCLGFIWCLTSLSNRMMARGLSQSVVGSQTLIGPFMRLAHR